MGRSRQAGLVFSLGFFSLWSFSAAGCYRVVVIDEVDAGNVCGNTVCETPAESCRTCPADCGACAASCGNGVCEALANEACCRCPEDCGPCPPSCGDGCCLDGQEDCFSCAADCHAPQPPVGGTLALDLVLVIDDSGSMWEEQQNLAANVARLIEPLVSPPDANGDGVPDYLPVEDVHVAIVSSALGAGLTSCSSDDGLFIDSYRPSSSDPYWDASCAAITYPRFLSWRAGDPAYTTANLAHDASCLAMLGTLGCGYEQHLEATFRALTTHLIGGGLNNLPGEPFLRANSILAVVFLGDEDDCSASDDTLFDPTRTDLGPANLRCFNNPTYLHPVSRYQEGFLRDILPTHPIDRIVVADIGGIPIDLSGLSPTEILADPRMVPMVDPAMPTNLLPSCSAGGAGVAYPNVRRLEFLAPFAAIGNATAHSICASDFAPAVAAIANRIQQLLVGQCL